MGFIIPWQRHGSYASNMEGAEGCVEEIDNGWASCGVPSFLFDGWNFVERKVLTGLEERRLCRLGLELVRLGRTLGVGGNDSHLRPSERMFAEH